MKKKGLTYKQEMFCQAYIANGGNASEAYRQAYPVSLKWSDTTVAVKACELMKNEFVGHRIAELQKELREKADVKKSEVLEMAVASMRHDIRDFVTIKDGKVVFKDSDEWTPEMAKLVEGVKVTKNGIELELLGKKWSIERICKMLGFDSPEKIEHSGKVEMPAIVVRTEEEKKMLEGFNGD